MPLTIRVNGTSLTLVHKFSIGISTATIPDVCKTPSPGGPVPVPYPNIANSITLSSGTSTVKGDKAMAANKGSKFALSNGDNAGVAGGVKSSTFMKEATWILYSFDVKMDGKNTARLTDKMFHNSENAANLGGVAQQPLIDEVGQAMADKLCDAACKAMEKKKKKDAKAKNKAKKSKKKPKPSTKKFQNEMRNVLDPKKSGQRGNQPGLITEASQDLAGGDFIGKWGAATGSGKGCARWDIVLVGVKKVSKKLVEKGKLMLKDVFKIIEVKFPGDSPTDNQKKMLKMSPKTDKKVFEMRPAEHCICS
ncbi:PAAR-like domain-containing protein [Variovorax sp. R-27]|jgi:hypothetical protein|uniref:PAAR-like domain-containing protein n=1 Tax=Variovorax sp. R-27 TaxID=3404058 RepID=UPI003CEBB871